MAVVKDDIVFLNDNVFLLICLFTYHVPACHGCACVTLCSSAHCVYTFLIRSLRVPSHPSPSKGFSFSRVPTLFLLPCPSSSFVSGSRALPAASAFHGFTTTPLRPQRHDAGAHYDDISAGPCSSYSDAAGPSSYVIFVFTGRFALLTRQAPAALTSRQAPAAHTLMRQAPAVLSSRQAPAAQSVPRHSVVRLAWVSYMQVMVTLVSSMSDGRLLLAVG